MTRPRARVIKSGTGTQAIPLLAPGPSPAQRRRIAREEIEARLAAEKIVDDARARAEEAIARAREEARDAAERMGHEAREAEVAKLAAHFLAVKQAEHDRIEHDTDRVVALAVALAERLLGASLELGPERITHLARAVIAEARGARRAVVHAHPLDAAALRRDLTVVGLDLQTVEICDDDALARGDLRLHTDVGTIDAKLSPRLERLAAALRDALE